MKISLEELKTLPQQRLDINFKESFEGLGAVKPVLGKLTVVATATGMRLFGSVNTLLRLTCHRCLASYFQGLSVTIDEYFLAKSWQGHSVKENQKERELCSADFIEQLPADGTLDIGDIVYQAVTLATPNTCSCGEACPGLPYFHTGTKEVLLACDKEGKQQAGHIDPRWRNLKSLFLKEETDTKS